MIISEIGVPDNLDEIIELLNAVGLSFSVIEPDGTAYGWMTTERNTSPDGSATLWFGLVRDGDKFRFDVSEGQVYDVYEGEHQMMRFGTEQEVKAFLLGNLLGFTGLDARAAKEALLELTEDDPYRRSAELHKSGWCPIWNDWQHYFTERRESSL